MFFQRTTVFKPCYKYLEDNWIDFFRCINNSPLTINIITRKVILRNTMICLTIRTNLTRTRETFVCAFTRICWCRCLLQVILMQILLPAILQVLILFHKVFFSALARPTLASCTILCASSKRLAVNSSTS